MKRLIPFLLLMYVVAFLDRANVGFAKAEIKQLAGISDAAFAFGASVFFVAYVALEIPSNIMMARVGARAWMCRIMVTWGLVSAATMFIQGPASFYAIRMLLGACEAGFFPGVILYLTYWFPDNRRARMTGLFFFGAPLAFIFGAPVSGVLLKMHGFLGLHGYQWMFLLEGLLASAVGVWAYFYLDNKPKDAKWLDADEKKALTDLIESEQRDKLSHGPAGMLAAMKDPKTLYFALIYCLVQTGVSVVVFFLPSFIGRLLGQSAGPLVGIVVAIPWICALIAVYAIPKLAERLKKLMPFGAVSLIVAGAAMYVSSGDNLVVSVIAMCFAVAALWASQPIFWTLLTDYLGGAAAVCGVAFVNCVANIGNFVAPNIKNWADVHYGSPVAGLVVLSGFVLLAGLLFLGLRDPKSHDVLAAEAA